MYDAIIIGAGPAGSTAAKALAEKGCRVLLAERAKLPRYKSCSGMLIQKTLRLTEQYFGRPVPASVTCAPAENRGMVLTDAWGQEFCFPQPGLNVWRSAFDAWLAERAAEHGAELRQEMAAVLCEPHETSVTVAFQGGRREEARYVLNCGGAAVSRRLLDGPSPETVITYQAFYEGSIQLDPHFFYAYLQPELSGYDAWFNVKDGLLVLGVSAENAGVLAAYHRRFLAYLEKRHSLHLGRKCREEKWLMPRVRPGCPVNHGMDRVFLAGEAAGFLNPMGEGISAGMESAWAAAQAVSAHSDSPTAALADYQKRTEALRAYMSRQWNLTAGLSERFREMRR